MTFQERINRIREGIRRQAKVFRQWPGPVKTGASVTLILSITVVFAAVWPGSSKRAGEWEALAGEAELAACVQADYQTDSGRLQLRLDTQTLARVVAEPEKQRWIAAHVRRFNREFANRRFDPRKIPGDSLFQVEMMDLAGSLLPRVSVRDLSPHNTHPRQALAKEQLGAIYFRKGDRPTPFVSDGFLGLSLEPGDGPAQTVSLDSPGLYHGHRFHLVDPRGASVATLWSSASGEAVHVQGESGRGVFIDNNPALTDSARGLTSGELFEIAGRFFEVRIEEAPALATSADRGDIQKRIYPMGANLHMVGPVSRNGRHQSLGLEYMFQEYLTGIPETGIPPGEIWLTLEPRIQSLWASGMSQLAKRSERKTASGLLMNAQTGDILAMGADPQPYDPGDSDLILRMLDRGEERFANHGNFRRHVIGSVTKPFFAFAALNLDPKWEQVEVQVMGSGSPTLFGHRLYGASSKSMEFKRNTISFDTYLTMSDNAFQHSLGLLLLGGITQVEALPKPWLSRGANGKLILVPTANHSSALVFGTLGARGRDSLAVPRDHAVTATFRTLFDIDTAAGDGIPNDRDLGIYAPLLPMAESLLQRYYPRLSNPREILLRRSVVCAPETPRLAMEAVANTKDASNLLFGGKFNLWTDVKLAEAFSRLVTAKKIKANLIYGYRDTLGEGAMIQTVPEVQPFQIPNEVRDGNVFRTIRKELANVVTVGTARKLAPTVRKIRETPGNENFRIFAKTGTIDDGEGKDSRLFVATFGLWDASEEAFQGDAFTFVLYLRNAQVEDDILDFIAGQLPQWWTLLQKPAVP